MDNQQSPKPFPRERLEPMSYNPAHYNLNFIDKLLFSLQSDLIVQILAVLILLTSILLCIKCLNIDIDFCCGCLFKNIDRKQHQNESKARACNRRGFDDSVLQARSPAESQRRVGSPSLRFQVQQPSTFSPAQNRASEISLTEERNTQSLSHFLPPSAQSLGSPISRRSNDSPVSQQRAPKNERQFSQFLPMRLRHSQASMASESRRTGRGNSVSSRNAQSIQKAKEKSDSYKKVQQDQLAWKIINFCSSEFHPEETTEDQVCCICLDPLEAGKVQRQVRKCGHKFHLDCLGEWVRNTKKSPVCPLCKANLIQ